MRSAALRAGLTGLHFAALQLGLLLTVQSVSSSSWQSYAAISSAWIAGSVAGLWLPLRPMPSLLAGVLAFEICVFCTRSWPFAAWLPVLAAVAAACAGLWAGGFFVHAVRHRSRPSRLFFHENNGFALGLVLVVLGFAFFGRTALALLPLLTGGALLSTSRADRHQDSPVSSSPPPTV